MSDFECEAVFLAQQGLSPEKLGTVDEPGPALTVVRDQWRALSDQWMEKRSAPKHQKRHRRSSYEFLMGLDHQLLASSGVGLSRFSKPDAGWDKATPLKWPLLSFATDQCAIVVCGTNWLLHGGPETNLSLC